MDEFSQFVYETLPEPSTMGSFIFTASATIFGGFLLYIFRPFLLSWARTIKQNYDKNRVEEKAAWAYFINVIRGSRAEELRCSRQIALRYLRKTSIAMVIMATLIGLLWGVANPIAYEYSEQSRLGLLSVVKENLAEHDELHSQLKRQTGNRIGPKSFCEESEQELERKHVELVCQKIVHAELGRDCSENKRYDEIRTQRYDTCMLERGWIVSPCDETDVDCVKIWSSAPNCQTLRWKTFPNYIGRECLNYIPYDEMVVFAEYECSLRATRFAFDSMYEGYSERDRIWNTASVYDLCMHTKGWITSECSKEDVIKNGCVTIPFPQSLCRVRVKNWAEAEDIDFENLPCEGQF